MCGRWSLATDEQTLLDRFQADLGGIRLQPRYNIAPMQEAPILRNDSPKEFSMARWGLVPHWAKDDKMAFNTINARADGLEDKPTYKVPLKEHRCLIPADGFYEWKKTPQEKIPYRFTLKDGELFAFAGLFDIWDNNGKPLTTFTIITVEPNAVVKQVHVRMPAILRREDESSWLSEKDSHKALKLLQPYPAEDMVSIRLTTRINSSKLEGPELILPYQEQPGLNRFFK